MASANKSKTAVLIFVAPQDGTGGVGDYAEHVLADIRGMFDEVHEIRTRAPEEDSLKDIRRWRRELRRLERRFGVQNTVVHAELASGAVGPFWVLRASRSARRSAIIHDAPYPVWWPLHTREVVSAMHSSWRFNIWYGRFERRILGGFLRRLERTMLRGVSVTALSGIGAEKISGVLGGTPVLAGRHYVPSADIAGVVPVVKRPLAVGLFGHVYGGKGFELLTRLRVEIPDEIEIRVAGRGTEALESMRGVTIIGTVDGTEERDFFNSIRALVLPYNRLHGKTPVYPASGAAARAFSFHTPVVSSRAGTFIEAAHEGGLLSVGEVDPVSNVVDVAALAAATVELIGDESRLEALRNEVVDLAKRRTISGSLEPLVARWSTWIGEIHDGNGSRGGR